MDSDAIPNEITPMAWKTPSLINNDPLRLPFRSDGTRTPCVMTVTMITSILINANVDAFANYIRSVFSF